MGNEGMVFARSANWSGTSAPSSSTKDKKERQDAPSCRRRLPGVGEPGFLIPAEAISNVAQYKVRINPVAGASVRRLTIRM